MRFIPVNVHNIMDYIYGVLITASPWLFGFTQGGAETYIMVSVGIFGLLISLITNYKYSLAKIIAFNFHLKLDLVIGIFLVISPWLFGFSDYVYKPHLIFGLFAIVVSLTSKRFVNYKEY
jgi:hypothetical protein